MKRFFFVILFSIFTSVSFATHITGGEMIYEYLGPGSVANTIKYQITLRLFRDEAANTSTPPGAQMPTSVWIAIFNNDNLQQYPGNGQYFDVPRTGLNTVPVAPFPPCMTNIPTLNYTVGYFTFIIDLPINQKGYTGTYNTCCRVHPMVNKFAHWP
jgi:hypothetical protein